MLAADLQPDGALRALAVGGLLLVAGALVALLVAMALSAGLLAAVRRIVGRRPDARAEVDGYPEVGRSDE